MHIKDILANRDWAVITSWNSYNTFKELELLKSSLNNGENFLYVSPSKISTTNMVDDNKLVTKSKSGDLEYIDTTLEEANNILASSNETVYLIFNCVDSYTSVMWWDTLLNKLSALLNTYKGRVKVVLSGYSPALLCAGAVFSPSTYSFMGDGVYTYDKDLSTVTADQYNDLTIGYWKWVKANLERMGLRKEPVQRKVEIRNTPQSDRQEYRGGRKGQSRSKISFNHRRGSRKYAKR